MKKILLICISFIIGTTILAQDKKENFILRKLNNDKTSRKGKISISWGYNRASYAKSTIRFWGDDYDFKINKSKDELNSYHLSSIYIL